METFLGFFARHAKFVLVAGLIVGILFPRLAFAMKPWLPELVAVLLFVTALRIGPRQVFKSSKGFRPVIKLVLVYQVFIPLTFALLFWITGLNSTTAFAIVLMASASSISGAPSLAIMTGNDGAPAMRMLIVGTALLPVTILPVFFFIPEIGDVGSIFSASGRLVLLIVAATVTAGIVRIFLFPNPKPSTLSAFDGLSAITMAVVVVGLMSAVGPALTDYRVELLTTLVLACAINWGLQLLTYFSLKSPKWMEERVSYAIVAGNRNIALFFAALPVAVTDPILLFIGCYQIPMYLTPIVMGRIYKNEV